MSVDEPSPRTGRNRWMFASISLAFLAAVLLIAIVALALLRSGQESLEFGCSSQGSPFVYAPLDFNHRTHDLASSDLHDVCFTDAVLHLEKSAKGTATVSVADVVILTIDLAAFTRVGRAGSGGAVIVDLPKPVRLQSGQLITLDLGNCSVCELSVGLRGGPPE